MRDLKCIDTASMVQSDSIYVYVPLDDSCNEDLGSYDVVSIPSLMRRGRNFPKPIRGSYDRIGDVAIIKIRDADRSMKIAKSLVSSGTGIRGVWHDSGVKGQNRVRKLDFLAGEKITHAIHVENGLRFSVDIDQVYFSPRLATERMRISREVRDGEFIIDMFAGIGPFSISIAREKNVRIIAIDSNKSAIKCMLESIKMNNLKGEIEAICGDSRKIMPTISKADRIIMNLPHEAIDYLSEAVSALSQNGTIHLYVIGDAERIEEVMEIIRSMGLSVKTKRIVHGYSSTEELVSFTLNKNNLNI